MDLFHNLLLGFETALSLHNLVYAFIGCLLGTLIGILPGLGPLTTISMLLPFSFGLEPTTALIMLAGIYYGAAYGGSTTAILINLPGETSSVVTVLDGYQMARQGRAGVAITTAAVGSFFGGCIGTLVLAAFAIPLTQLALQFGPAEYFSLMVLGLVGAVSLSSGSTLKAVGMILIGVCLGFVGSDLTSGVQRFTFGNPRLWEGINFIVIAVGMFAFGEVIASLEEADARVTGTAPVGSLLPTRQDRRRMMAPILRGTAVGCALGILPGAGQSIASFFAYAFERRFSRYSHELGKGAIEGVAAPESANNAAAQTAFIPTLTLGIPGSATMALMLGAMVMHNIQPGPGVMISNPSLFWGLIASMWIGNLILVVLNLPLVGVWVRLLRIPYGVLFPAVMLLGCMGVYSSSFSSLDLLLAAGFGFVGYVFKKLECPVAPLILGFVLGPGMEKFFRRALTLSEGDFLVFFSQPGSAVLLIIAMFLLTLSILPSFRRKRNEVAEAEA